MALYIQLILSVRVRVRIIQRQLMHGAYVIQETTVIATAVYSINCNMYPAAFKAQRMWTIYPGNCYACRCQCCHTGAMNIGKKCAYHIWQLMVSKQCVLYTNSCLYLDVQVKQGVRLVGEDLCEACKRYRTTWTVSVENKVLLRAWYKCVSSITILTLFSTCKLQYY